MKELEPTPRDKTLSFLAALAVQAKQEQAAQLCFLELFVFAAFQPVTAKA